MRIRYLAILLCCALLLPSWTFSFGDSPRPLPEEALPARVDISSLAPFLATLPPDEQDEQLRDWACYGLRSLLGLAAEGEFPVRHPGLGTGLRREVSRGRVFEFSPRQWGVIVPVRELGDKPLIGGLLDRHRVARNTLPDSVAIFTYEVDPDLSGVRIVAAGSTPGQELFTPAYGYHETSVASAPEFEAFIRRIDDLVKVQWRDGKLFLGGRKFRKDDRGSLSLEEIAVLVQAYAAPGESLLSREEAERKYREMLRSDGKLREAVRKGKVKKRELLAKIRRQGAPPPDDSGVGFSLDPDRDYPGIAGELEALARQLESMSSSHNATVALQATSRSKELVAAARRIRGGKGLAPLLELRRRYAAAGDASVNRFAEILQEIEERHSFQVARYDGPLRGTGTGMILFYTDLLAKLWVLDYQGIAPKQAVRGFRAIQDIPVPKLYWSDFRRLSKTRLWFGLQQEGFDIHGDTMLFQPIVTRVYAASSDPLQPGRESEPNYQSGEFLGWWNDHYAAMADYEPYYHKLNQIQKWSTVIMVLKEKKAHFLDFLLPLPVARDADFEGWLKGKETLASRINIPFLDRSKFGRATECLPVLRSRGYETMGKHYYISGGVSLASRSDILAKLRQHPHPGEPAAAPSERPQPGLRALPGGKGRADASGPRRGATPGGGEARGGRVPPRTAGRGEGIPGKGAARMPARSATDGGGYGKFAAVRQPGAVRLTWDKGPVVAQHDLVAALAARQQADPQGSRGEAVFNGVPGLKDVVRVREGSAYLVRTASTGGDWIYLGINPAKPEEYPAKGSGSFAEADIFGARLVSAAEARKLVAGRPQVNFTPSLSR